MFLGLVSKFRNSHALYIGPRRISESKDTSNLLIPSVAWFRSSLAARYLSYCELRNRDTRLLTPKNRAPKPLAKGVRREPDRPQNKRALGASRTALKIR